MRIFLLILVALLTFSFRCLSQTQESQIEIVDPSIQQEATSIWRTINDIAFFERQGYVINLPTHPIINSLVAKSRRGDFGNEDMKTVVTFLENNIFDPKNYEKAKQKVENQVELINRILDQIKIEKSKWDWEFKTFEKYQVVFTLYGTGGSYDPDEGIITLLTNSTGGFMKYENPAYTIIHEITHMGMEYSIVQKYQVSHGLKERLVDTFVYLMFQEELPEYKIQRMGDERIDENLNVKEDFELLNSIVSEFMDK